jgi:polysaccharide chain length determinant protein (PEP-CTERM system associated)
VAAVWAVCAIGWTVVWRLPDYYESTARVYMNADEALTPLLHGIALDRDVNARVDRLERTLLSVTNMKKLIRMTDLDDRVHDAADRDATVAMLQKAIKIKPQTRNLFTVSYRDGDPVLAESVVSNLLSLFMETAAGDSRTDIDSAQRFLQAEIDRLETILREDERKKAEFQSRYYDLLPQAGSGVSVLDRQRTEVEKVSADLTDAVAARDSLQKQRDAVPRYEAPPPATVPTGPGGLALSPQTRLAQLRAKLEIAKATMTDEHPLVIALKHQIEEVSAKVKALKASGSLSPARGSVENPLYRNLTVQLDEKNVEVASLRRKLASAEEDLDRLEDEMRKAPSVVAEFANLNRDYDVVKKNYEELLARRESAEIGENADRRGDRIVARTIDAPEVPVLPAGPNRPLFLSLVLGVAIGVGAAVALVLSQLDESFSTITALELLGLPVLGAIDHIESLDRNRGQWFRGAKAFVSACLILVIVYGSLLLLFIDRHRTSA